MVKILRESNEIKQIPLECIKGATLLSYDEAENLLTQEDKVCPGTKKAMKNGLWCGYGDDGNSPYWLRTSYVEGCPYATAMDGGGATFFPIFSHVKDGIGIRPALIVDTSSSGLKIGDIFEFGEYTFKVISNDLAICSVIVDTCPFKKKKGSNKYEKSYVKQMVNKWFNETMGTYKGIKPDDIVADENDFGF